MRIPRIHVDHTLAAGAELALPAAAASHLVRVLRLRPGAPLVLFDGRGGEYPAELLGGSGPARARVGVHRLIERESPLRLTLLQGIARGERMDLIVQKATELGVSRIAPCLTEFGVVRLDATQAARRVARWRAIAIGACEQCGRNRPPQVDPVATFAAALDALAADGPRYLLDAAAPRQLAATAGGIGGATLLIGPEGGLSDAERALAERHGFEARRLGPRVLRTETAPLVALAVLQSASGDLGTE